jgi:hypothetical protein
MCPPLSDNSGAPFAASLRCRSETGMSTIPAARGQLRLAGQFLPAANLAAIERKSSV